MRRLTILYDASCELCRSARSWLEEQPAYLPLEFIPAGSSAARRRFPELDADATLEELTVIGDDGAVYRGAKAWIMCLWALREYRSWALDLSTPALFPVARRVIAAASDNRRRLGPFARSLGAPSR